MDLFDFLDYVLMFFDFYKFQPFLRVILLDFAGFGVIGGAFVFYLYRDEDDDY